MSARHPPVQPAFLTELRAICMELPEAYEEAAWVGTRLPSTAAQGIASS